LRGSYRYRPHERLLESRQYQKVKKEGRRAKTAHFGVNYNCNRLSSHRLGLVVQKRFWNSVHRNRIKRCLREWFRIHKKQIPLPGKDIVIVARPGAERLSVQDISTELMKIFQGQGGCKR